MKKWSKVTKFYIAKYNNAVKKTVLTSDASCMKLGEGYPLDYSLYSRYIYDTRYKHIYSKITAMLFNGIWPSPPPSPLWS